jgi:hypothetical protein
MSPLLSDVALSVAMANHDCIQRPRPHSARDEVINILAEALLELVLSGRVPPGSAPRQDTDSADRGGS